MTRLPIDNGNGRATAMTLLTAMRPGRIALQRFVFLLVRKVPLMTKALRDLAIVHVGWWSIIERIPDNGPPQQSEVLRSPYLLFESNFDGPWEPYIDTFGQRIAWKVNAVWGSCWGFPGARPTSGAIRYVDEHQLVVDHFYAAYPDGTPKTVLAGLRLRDRFDAFQAEIADLDDEHFEAAYRRFVRGSQADL